MSRKQKATRNDIYARITDRIVAELDKGVRSWIQPRHSANAGGRVTRPLRHNGPPCSGMNVLLLWSEATARKYASPMWMTFRQPGVPLRRWPARRRRNARCPAHPRNG